MSHRITPPQGVFRNPTGLWEWRCPHCRRNVQDYHTQASARSGYSIHIAIQHNEYL